MTMKRRRAFAKNPLTSFGDRSADHQVQKEHWRRTEETESYSAIITLARRNDHLWNVTRLQQERGAAVGAADKITCIVRYTLRVEWAYTIAGFRSYPTETISRFVMLRRVFFFFCSRRPENADLTLIVCHSTSKCMKIVGAYCARARDITVVSRAKQRVRMGKGKWEAAYEEKEWETAFLCARRRIVRF